MTYSLTMPAGWERLALGEDSASSVDEVVARATARLPRDSAAPTRHRLTAKLRGVIEELAQSEGAAMRVVYFPTPAEGANLLPMTLTCGTALGVDPVSLERPTEFLVTLAQTSPGSAPVDVDGVVALRTLTFADVTENLVTELDEAAALLGEARPAEPEPPHAFQLRASYLFADPERSDWHLVVGSATVPSDEAEASVNVAVVDLFDAMMSTVRWDR